MKVGSFYLALVLMSLGSAWGFVTPSTKTPVVTQSTTTSLDMAWTTYGDRTSRDGSYSLGSSFLQGNMFNDPYAFERRYDRNSKDDVKIDPWGYWGEGAYYGVSSFGKRLSPFYK